jgi:hypothetical protein
MFLLLLRLFFYNFYNLLQFVYSILGNCPIVSWFELLVISDFYQIIKSTTAFDQQL